MLLVKSVKASACVCVRACIPRGWCSSTPAEESVRRVGACVCEPVVGAAEKRGRKINKNDGQSDRW